jgi:hypothetical protein
MYQLEPCVLQYQHGEGVSRDVSRLHPGRSGGSIEYAHVLSHMSEMGGAGISALKSNFLGSTYLVLRVAVMLLAGQAYCARGPLTRALLPVHLTHC